MKKYLNVCTNIFFVLTKTAWIFMKRNEVCIYSCKNIRYNNYHTYSTYNRNSALYCTKYPDLQAKSMR